MRVPLSWLREFTEWPGDGLAEALTARGLAVEAVENPGAGAHGLYAARVLAVEDHPRAERLRVCTVQADGRRATVVSGAPNLRVGMTTVWAAPGAVLPGGAPVRTRTLRGVDSQGILCAPDEAGLPGGHEGVCELTPGDVPPGLPGLDGVDLARALHVDDPVLVLELTANYAAHCQSVLGVAREVAAITGDAVRLPSAGAVACGDAAAADAVTLRVQAEDLCERYVARVVEGVRPERAPLWMQQRLVQCGMRPVLGVVDVTNYVMLELGQPLHAFDLDRIAGGGVVVRRARDGERVVTLDGRLRELLSEDLVIADANGAVAIAGVMGAQRAEVDASTRRVLLESATFAPDAVARTARRLGLPSEAAARFARGVDPEVAGRAADRAVALLALYLGGQPLAGAVEARVPRPVRGVTLRGSRVRALLGVRLSTAACGRQLERFGFRVQADGPDRLRVHVPSWRPDVALEVDLIEEIARAYGYDRLPASPPPPGLPPEGHDPVAALARLTRALALGAGFTEVQPYSYHERGAWDRLRLPPGHRWRSAVEVENPMSADQQVLRTTLAVGLLRTLEVNARRRRTDAAVFEVGHVFRARPGDWPLQVVAFGAAATGDVRTAGWGWPAVRADFFTLKGLCEEVLERAGVPPTAVRWQPAPDAYPSLHPGRSAEARTQDGALLGWVGELHPEVCAAFELRPPAALAELDLAAVAGAARPFTGPRPLPQHPPARRDLALLAPEVLPAADVERAIRELGAPLLADCRLFDVFTGGAVPPGQRSLAYALTYQDPARTLTDAEVDAAHEAVRLGLTRRFPVTLRS